MLTHCEEAGLGPINVCMGTTVSMNTGRSGVWLGPLVDHRFTHGEGLFKVRADYGPHSGGSDSHAVIQQ